MLKCLLIHSGSVGHTVDCEVGFIGSEQGLKLGMFGGAGEGSP
jgi:hypothetical protein